MLSSIWAPRRTHGSANAPTPSTKQDPYWRFRRLFSTALTFLSVSQLVFSQSLSSPLQNHVVNSWFDHTQPIYQHDPDSTMTRFDGSVSGGGDPLTNGTGCSLGLGCYNGHDGIDLDAATGTDVYASEYGLAQSGCTTTLGPWVRIWHPTLGFWTYYGHLSAVDPSIQNIPTGTVPAFGTWVPKGARIGASGSPPNSNAPHLHFGVYLSGGPGDQFSTCTNPTNPLPLTNPIDPYGWIGTGSDPWTIDLGQLLEARPYCFGDNSHTTCPCNNPGLENGRSRQHGCANSATSIGAYLRTNGTPNLQSDTLTLFAGGMPNSLCLYIQGTAIQNGGLGVVLGDGLRCIGGQIVRLGQHTNIGGSSTYPDTTDQPISVRGSVPASGGTRHYQAWYRDTSGPCHSGFNLTNGVSVIWSPTSACMLPLAITQSPSNVTATSAILNGSANPNGCATNAWFEYGTTPAYGGTTGQQALGFGSSPVPFSATISNLQPSTLYHYRAVASNSGGTSYGADLTFTTGSPPCNPPIITTQPASNVTANSATLNGTVNPNGCATNAWFEYGTTGAYGGQTSPQSVGSGSSPVAYSATVFNLQPNTLYHYRAVASNSGGTSFGADVTFVTGPLPCNAPGVATQPASNITATSAILNGSANPNGCATNAWFEYGTTPAYGGTTGQQPLGSGSSPVPFSATISNLQPNTLYHYRAVASNSGGTSYGADVTFMTLKLVTVANTGGFGLRLHVDHSTGSTVIATLADGTQMTVLAGPIQAEGYTWWNITGSPGTGWSAIGEWLTPIQPTVGSTVTVSYTGGFGLRLRADHSTSAQILATMPDGTHMTVIGGPFQGEGFTWWQLTGSPGTGWSAVGNWLVPNPR